MRRLANSSGQRGFFTTSAPTANSPRKSWRRAAHHGKTRRQAHLETILQEIASLSGRAEDTTGLVEMTLLPQRRQRRRGIDGGAFESVARAISVRPPAASRAFGLPPFGPRARGGTPVADICTTKVLLMPTKSRTTHRHSTSSRPNLRRAGPLRLRISRRRCGWWMAVLEDYDLDKHHLLLLEAACGAGTACASSRRDRRNTA